MAQLIRWDPFREMAAWRSAMDRMFEDTLGRSFDYESPRLGLALDVAENDDSFIIEASIPGINPDDLEISLSDNVLTIKGEMKRETEYEEGQYHLRERRFGSFCRSVTLPTNVQVNAIEATYTDGILKLVAPKAEEVKPRRISVHTSKTIEGETT